jgi:hypothetical protein
VLLSLVLLLANRIISWIIPLVRLILFHGGFEGIELNFDLYGI